MVAGGSNGDYVRVSCDGQVIGQRVKLMLNGLSRLKGLLGTRRLPEGSGALLAPCRSVHMFGMLYSVDVLFLDRQQRVVNVKRNLRPFAFALGGPGSYSTIELPAASLDKVSVAAGDTITLERCNQVERSDPVALSQEKSLD